MALGRVVTLAALCLILLSVSSVAPHMGVAADFIDAALSNDRHHRSQSDHPAHSVIHHHEGRCDHDHDDPHDHGGHEGHCGHDLDHDHEDHGGDEGYCDHDHDHDHEEGGYLVVPEDGGPIEYDYALRLQTAADSERTAELVMRARGSGIFLATQPSHVASLARSHGYALVFLHEPHTNSLSDDALEALTAAVAVVHGTRDPRADGVERADASGETDSRSADNSYTTSSQRAELVEPHTHGTTPIVVVDVRLILRDPRAWDSSISRWLVDLPALVRVDARVDDVSGATLKLTARSLDLALHGAAFSDNFTGPSEANPLRFVDGVLE